MNAAIDFRFGYTAITAAEYVAKIASHLAMAFGGDSQVTTQDLINALVRRNLNGVVLESSFVQEWTKENLLSGVVEYLSSRWEDGFDSVTVKGDTLRVVWNWGGLDGEEVVDLKEFNLILPQNYGYLAN